MSWRGLPEKSGGRRSLQKARTSTALPHLRCSSVPVEKHGVNGHLRQKGKIAELALGYGGSVGALKAMGALEMGLSEDELPAAGRLLGGKLEPRTLCRFWWDDRPCRYGMPFEVSSMDQRDLRHHSSAARAGCSSSRSRPADSLAYVKPKTRHKSSSAATVSLTKASAARKKWERLDSYGPKFVENIVQATARDILCYAMQTLPLLLPLSCTSTMKLVIEARLGESSLQVVCDQMGRTPPWANGLKLRADGYETDVL